MLVDSHCHLDRLDLSKYPNGLEDALSAAREQGVSEMLCVCISEANKDAVLAIAAENPGIYASVGVHPSDVSDAVVGIEQLKQWAEADKVVALGETGLDYYHSSELAEQQQQSFINHLKAGADLNLPVIVHTREAQADTISLMRTHAGFPKCRGYALLYGKLGNGTRCARLEFLYFYFRYCYIQKCRSVARRNTQTASRPPFN